MSASRPRRADPAPPQPEPDPDTVAPPQADLPLSVYRQPVQARSRQTFGRILDATLTLLAEHGVESLTTNRVAQAAGISVATLYRFFPNKESIVYAAYEHWTTDLTRRVDEAVAAWRADPVACAAGWPKLAHALADTLGGFHPSANAEYELLRAMWSRRELLRLDQSHSRRLAERVAALMTETGSPMPAEELTVLAGFANELFTLATERAGPGDPATQHAVAGIARQAYLALWAQAMTPSEKAPGEPPPA